MPVNLLDLIHKHFGYSQFWSSQPARNQNWAGSCMPDLTAHIRFISILLKKAWIILCEIGLDPNWMAWSGFGQTHLVQMQSGVIESSGPVLAEHNSQLPVYHFQTWLHFSTDSLDHIVQNQPGSNLVLADCQVLAKQIQSESKPACKNHWACFWPTLPS